MRVLDLEGLADQVVDEVDLRAAHIVERHGVDQHLGAVAGKHDVVRRGRLLNQVVAILEAGAAAAFDADAERGSGRLRGQDLGDPADGAVGKRDVC